MTAPRWHKVLADLLGNKTRTILAILSIAIGLFTIGFVSASGAIMMPEIDANYAAAKPHSAMIYTEPFDESVLQEAQALPGVGSAGEPREPDGPAADRHRPEAEPQHRRHPAGLADPHGPVEPGRSARPAGPGRRRGVDREQLAAALPGQAGRDDRSTVVRRGDAPAARGRHRAGRVHAGGHVRRPALGLRHARHGRIAGRPGPAEQVPALRGRKRPRSKTRRRSHRNGVRVPARRRADSLRHLDVQPGRAFLPPDLLGHHDRAERAGRHGRAAEHVPGHQHRQRAAEPARPPHRHHESHRRAHRPDRRPVPGAGGQLRPAGAGHGCAPLRPGGLCHQQDAGRHGQYQPGRLPRGPPGPPGPGGHGAAHPPGGRGRAGLIGHARLGAPGHQHVRHGI